MTKCTARLCRARADDANTGKLTKYYVTTFNT